MYRTPRHAQITIVLRPRHARTKERPPATTSDARYTDTTSERHHPTNMGSRLLCALVLCLASAAEASVYNVKYLLRGNGVDPHVSPHVD